MALVIQGLAKVGYVGRYRLLRASDVGAPHERERIFIAAEPAADAGSIRRRPRGAGTHGDGGPDLRTVICSPPRPARDHKGHNQRGDTTCLTGALLPTPAVNDMGEGKTVEQWDGWTDAMRIKHGNGNGHGKSLAIEAQRLLPTPTSMDSHASGGGYNGQTNMTLTDATARQPERWGIYTAAVAHWEALTRPAPEPTQISRKGNPQLSPRFVEWLMGLPDGWVTDVPGLSREDMLRLLGNGVVPAQCAAALRWLLDMEEVA
jgi:DNA (cytosine-5)-methyltransferase 1